MSFGWYTGNTFFHWLIRIVLAAIAFWICLWLLPILFALFTLDPPAILIKLIAFLLALIVLAAPALRARL